MAHTSLNERDTTIVGECLACVASADVIKNDWEFPSLFGMSFAEFLVIARSWPDVALNDEQVALATRAALGNLIGYPHNHNEIWGARIHASRDEVVQVLSKLPSEGSGDGG